MLNKETKIQLFEAMLRIRAFDEAEKALHLSKELPEYFPTVGRESVAVGVCLNLSQNDMITSTHRGLGHCLAKGMDQKKMLSEIWGKSSGQCKGKGGAWHLYDLSSGVIGTYPIVGAGIPIAVGAALASKMKRSNHIAVSFFSEGATTTGAFHESLNLASVLQVPVLFVCENNTFGDEYKQAMKIPGVAGVKTTGYGIQSAQVDGEDPEVVFEVSREMIAKVRSEMQPALLETTNPMITASPRRNPEAYARALKMRQERDEVSKYMLRIMDEGTLNQSEVLALQKRAKEQAEEAISFARKDIPPDLSEATTDIFS
jgi:acetoin:2,6-dichlorophenolindophenol oxidoreductase subunit alpha